MMTQAAADVDNSNDPNCNSVEEKRLLANEKYKAGNYLQAIELYGQAIDELSGGKNAADTLTTLYGNRAAAYLMLREYSQAVSDCQKAISLDPKFLKVSYYDSSYHHLSS